MRACFAIFLEFHMSLNIQKRLIVFQRDITILCHQCDSARWLIRYIRKALLVLLFLHQILHGIRYIDLPQNLSLP